MGYLLVSVISFFTGISLVTIYALYKIEIIKNKFFVCKEQLEQLDEYVTILEEKCKDILEDNTELQDMAPYPFEDIGEIEEESTGC
jgi:hypothetical protein